MKKHVPLAVLAALFFCFTNVQIRAQVVPSITTTPPDWYQPGDTFVSLDAEVFTAGWDSLYVGGYVCFQCNSGLADTLIEYTVYDPEFQNQGFGWFVHPLDSSMAYCWWGYVRRGSEYFWSDLAYWGMDPVPGIQTHAPQWYEITDTSAILDATVFTAGWDSLYVGGLLHRQCDTIATDTLYEYQVYDTYYQYQQFEWFQWGLQPTMPYCWWGYVRHNADTFWTMSPSYWGQHASPTGIKESLFSETAGYIDVATKVFVANHDVYVRVVTLLGQELQSFRIRAGETKDMSNYSSCFLVLCSQATGKVLGRCFVPN